MCCTCAGSNPSLLSPLNVFWVISTNKHAHSHHESPHTCFLNTALKKPPVLKCRLSVQCLAERFSHGWSHIAVEWRSIIKAIICLKQKSANESHVKSLASSQPQSQCMLTLGNDSHYFPADNLTHCRIKTEGAFTWLMSTFPSALNSM